jgi:hypothetical protein
MPQKKTPSLETLLKNGRKHEALLACEPSARSRTDLTFSGALEFISVERNAISYEISANLPLRLKACPHCASPKISLHGRYVIRLADLPYVDGAGRSMPVQYAITAQRYQCLSCNRGVVEPLPEPLKPVITNARITERLS